MSIEDFDKALREFDENTRKRIDEVFEPARRRLRIAMIWNVVGFFVSLAAVILSLASMCK